MASMYAHTAGKRQKVTRETSKNCDVNEFFAGLGVVEYRPDASPDDVLCYRYYNAGERINGKSMEDWMRPSISFRHTFSRRSKVTDGVSHAQYPWEDNLHTVDSYKRRVKAAFELYSKLGVKYWTLYDRDVAPEGDNLEETNHNLDEVVELIVELQQKTGVKPLWVAADLHSNGRYINGSATNPETQISVHSSAQLKKCLDITHKLGSECFLYQGAQEGYATILNTDLPRELHNYSRQLKMVANYKERLGYRGQLLFESNYTEGCNKDGEEYHRYDTNAVSALCLLKHYSLERNYKLSVAPGHQMFMASGYGMLGSIDATYLNSMPLVNETTLLMKSVIEQGGMQPGGLNIGINLLRQSMDFKELMIAYIQCIDVHAQGLRNAAKMVADGVFAKNLQQRYLSYHTGFGSRLANGEASLEDCDDHVRKQRTDIMPICGCPQHWQAVFSHYT